MEIEELINIFDGYGLVITDDELINKRRKELFNENNTIIIS